MPPGRRLCVYSGGFLSPRLRRILTLSGWRVTTGLPRAGDAVAVWGRSPRAWRGEAVAARAGVPILRIEDAFLRSLRPGRTGEPPLGLLIDRRGVHFDSRAPSDLEQMLACAPLDDPGRLSRARHATLRLQRAHLTKYSALDPRLAVPGPGYVLVVDQTRGDASIRFGGASDLTFRRMLEAARDEHPNAQVVIKSHPETALGLRPGHFGAADRDDRTRIVDAPVSPWRLIDGAAAVYTVSSQLGFESILAGHTPRVFGQPFYAGWGLSRDEAPVPRRTRRLSRDQLACAALIDAPVWYDPHRDRLAEVEDVLDHLEARARAWREDRSGHVASGMRLWKRRPLQRIFGTERALVFVTDPAKAAARAARDGRGLLVWAGREAPAHRAAPRLLRVEDGFLRSRGLGADLVALLSLVTDDLGIYYDPTRPSRLEALIARSLTLTPPDLARSRRLIDALIRRGVTKYNLGRADLPKLPAGRRILVPGQVEDDASIRLGTRDITTNATLLARVRADNPDAVILYKPHPDVEAGLRPGAIAADAADAVLTRADPAPILSAVDEVWTMTSTLGFEALIRGRSVTCLGQPFYAGWGLTRDLGGAPARRTARPCLEALVHAVLIDYPRYVDPVTGLPCPPEVAVERLASGTAPPSGPGLRVLSRLQGLFASQAHLWRRGRDG